MHRLPLLALGALLVVGTLSGCDETGNLTGGTVEQQIRNAQIARQNGDHATAVRILEAAHAAHPGNAPVRAELALTLLDRDGIDLLDLDRVASFVTREVSQPAAPSPEARLGTCQYAGDPTAAPISLADVGGFTDLAEARATIQQAMALIDPLIPAAVRGFALCSSITQTPSGSVVFAYDRAGALAQMRGMGLTDAQIGATLASNALVRFLDAYLFLALDLPQQVQWYRINNGTGIGLCAENPDLLLGQAQPGVTSLGQGALSVDLRATLFGATQTQQQLVELVADGYLRLRNAIGDYCN